MTTFTILEEHHRLIKEVDSDRFRRQFRIRFRMSPAILGELFSAVIDLVCSIELYADDILLIAPYNQSGYCKLANINSQFLIYLLIPKNHTVYV